MRTSKWQMRITSNLFTICHLPFCMRLELKSAGVQMDGRWLVREATLGLPAGSFTALVGPNGSGKTTLLRLLAGLWRPTEGRVRLETDDLQTLSRRRIAQRIAFTPQDTHLDFRFTVRDVIAQGRHPHLGRFEREGKRDRESISAAMERADVAHLSQRFVTELSGGERQRVLIARSLATETDVILLDEPTANLDISHTLDTLELCRSLAQDGKTIALALHDLNHAMRFATQVALVGAGRIVHAGAPQETLTDERIRAIFGVAVERATTERGANTLLFHRAD